MDINNVFSTANSVTSGTDGGLGSRPGLSRMQYPVSKILIIMRGLPGSGKSTLAW